MPGRPDARPRDPYRVPLVRQPPQVLRRGVGGGRRAAFRRGPGGRVLELLGRGGFALRIDQGMSSSSTAAADRSIGRGCCHHAAAVDDRSPSYRDRRSPMNTALLVLRIIPGLLLMGHGLQKIVPPGYSPPLLHAAGHGHTGAGSESLGIRPAVAAAVLAGSAELIAGFSLAAGLLTPVGTVLVGAVMITAILKVHVSNGIWAAEGGFEFPLVLLTVGFVVTALGPGSLSVDSWLGIDNWAGINWTINPAARSAIALAVGLAGGLVVALASRASKRTPTHASPQAAR